MKEKEWKERENNNISSNKSLNKYKMTVGICLKPKDNDYKGKKKNRTYFSFSSFISHKKVTIYFPGLITRPHPASRRLGNVL